MSSFLRKLTTLFAFFLLSSTSNLLGDTKIFIVRHAEKDTEPLNADPGLTDAGKARATSLASVLRSIPIHACIASQFQRTQQTIEEIAKSNHLELTIHPAGQEKDLIRKVRSEFVDRNIVIAAHSNTIPVLLRELGLNWDEEILESHFDNLWIVQIAEDQKPTLLHLHYGAADL